MDIYTPVNLVPYSILINMRILVTYASIFDNSVLPEKFRITSHNHKTLQKLQRQQHRDLNQKQYEIDMWSMHIHFENIKEL